MRRYVRISEDRKNALFTLVPEKKKVVERVRRAKSHIAQEAFLTSGLVRMSLLRVSRNGC